MRIEPWASRHTKEDKGDAVWLISARPDIRYESHSKIPQQNATSQKSGPHMWRRGKKDGLEDSALGSGAPL